MFSQFSLFLLIPPIFHILYLNSFTLYCIFPFLFQFSLSLRSPHFLSRFPPPFYSFLFTFQFIMFPFPLCFCRHYLLSLNLLPLTFPSFCPSFLSSPLSFSHPASSPTFPLSHLPTRYHSISFYLYHNTIAHASTQLTKNETHSPTSNGSTLSDSHLSSLVECIVHIQSRTTIVI